ncbi:glutathione S-transferase family protein [Neisseriaceae bacterium TC5R-5]|nr:glutathione S-transferase family protein [Neisseriaceae bacterium TC5R-5]
MSADLILYTHPMSRGRTVRWLLEEIGVPYQTEYLTYSLAMKTPEYLAINPMGKVPALVHHDVVITETAAICAYLADAFPQAKLSPALDDPQRGTYLRWLFFAAGPLESAIVNRTLGLLTPVDKEAMVGYGNMQRLLSTLNHALSQGDYLLGDRLSAADIYLGSALNWYLYMQQIEAQPLIQDYCARLRQRPACIRAAAIDDALLVKPEFALPE